ncbi:MAG: hypothetical protein Q7J54_05770 [Candidatus Woesearchaeota archaeon]|nr:hypothetical protein [Candidatus Woesearchaeota archaeon]
MKIKRRLTQAEEFEIMKITFDKFLWVGVIIMLFGLYQLFQEAAINPIYIILIGAVILVIFMIIIAKEYEIKRV